MATTKRNNNSSNNNSSNKTNNNNHPEQAEAHPEALKCVRNNLILLKSTLQQLTLKRLHEACQGADPTGV